MSDLQGYPWNRNLINNVEDSAICLALKVFNSGMFSILAKESNSQVTFEEN